MPHHWSKMQIQECGHSTADFYITIIGEYFGSISGDFHVKSSEVRLVECKYYANIVIKWSTSPLVTSYDALSQTTEESLY